MVKNIRNSQKESKELEEVNDNKNVYTKNPKDRTSFILNELIRYEEDKKIEYKNYAYPLPKDLSDVIKKQICGFLNSEGGRIYFGINDSGKVKGMVLSQKQKDLFRNELINYTVNFYPKCRTEKFEVKFIPIKNNKNVFIKNLYITKLIIKQGDTNKLYTINSTTYQSFMRMDGQVVYLSSEEIHKYIILRDKSPTKQIEDNHFIDPEPENPHIEEKWKSSNFSEEAYNPGSTLINFKGKRKEKEKLQNEKRSNPSSSSNENKKIKNEKIITNLIEIKLSGIPTFLSKSELIYYFKDFQILSHNIFVNQKGQCLGWGFINVTSEKVYQDLASFISILNKTYKFNMKCNKKKEPDSK